MLWLCPPHCCCLPRSGALQPAAGRGRLPALHAALVPQPEGRRVPALRLQRLRGKQQPLRQPGGVRAALRAAPRGRYARHGPAQRWHRQPWQRPHRVPWAQPVQSWGMMLVTHIDSRAPDLSPQVPVVMLAARQEHSRRRNTGSIPRAAFHREYPAGWAVPWQIRLPPAHSWAAAEPGPPAGTWCYF